MGIAKLDEYPEEKKRSLSCKNGCSSASEWEI
jgi:hypothetical protein